MPNHYQAEARERQRLWHEYSDQMEMIGAELRRLRIEKGLSLEAVARAMKMSKYRLCKIEHGLYASFDLNQLYPLSALYGVSPLEVLSIIPDSMFDKIL